MPIVAYLNVEHTVYYRLALDVLLEEESRLGIHLSTQEIGQRVRMRLTDAADLVANLPGIDGLLESLYNWGNVDRIYNMRRSGSAQEFLHKDFLYQLTSIGAQVHRTMTALDEEMGAVGSLQSSTLPEVFDALQVFVNAANLDHPDMTASAQAFQRLVHGFSALSENAKLFVQGLNRSLIVKGPDEIESFLAYKELIVGYLQTFIVALSRYRPLIADFLAQADDDRIARMFESIAEIEAPPQRGLSRADVVARDVARMNGQWSGLRSWFYETVDRPAVAQTLEQRASDAVNQILLTIRQINDQRFRRVDRSADLVSLASWFEGMQDAPEEELSALWRTAFGLYPARHLGVLRSLHDDDDAVESESWWTGRPAPVSAAYRAAGPRARQGPVPRIRSTRRAKSMLAAQQVSKMGAEANAERSLAARGTFRLSVLTELDDVEAEVLLRCLDVALSVAADDAGVHRAVTSDGRLQVFLTRVATRLAAVALRGGRASLEDLEMTIRLLEESP
ncbi:TIGR02677 family protein [Nocardia salmonicida]|uniref:TIGR02677 family protein n=1 Tax=Nocardia salmonicida TaxID=53431 RepID=UPI00366BBB89